MVLYHRIVFSARKMRIEINSENVSACQIINQIQIVHSTPDSVIHPAVVVMGQGQISELAVITTMTQVLLRKTSILKEYPANATPSIPAASIVFTTSPLVQTTTHVA